MYEKTFDEIAELCEVLGGLSISLEGYDGYDEIRITCFEDADGGYRANYIAHNIDGGFVYGGQHSCAFGHDAASALAPVFRNAYKTDDDLAGQVFEVNGMRDVIDGSGAELIYGSEAWDAFDRGEEVR